MTPPNPSEAAREAANETLANIMRKHIEDAARAEALAARLQSALSASAARVKELEDALRATVAYMKEDSVGYEVYRATLDAAEAALSIKVGETKDE